MSVVIMDGNKLKEEILDSVKDIVASSNRNYKLVVITVGDDAASKVYVNNKRKACEKVGIEFENKHINPAGKSDEDIINELQHVILSNKGRYCGVIVQSPIQGLSKVQETLVQSWVMPWQDVDAFGDSHVVDLYHGIQSIMSCTPQGILTMLEKYNIDLAGKHVVIVGRSNIVGKPLALAMLQKDATVTICHSKTKNLQQITRMADILVSAVGKPKFMDATYIKDTIEAIIDVGMNRDSDGKLCGDTDFESMIDRFYFQEDELGDTMKHYITPVPGGVGPMTVASLIQNIVKIGT